MVVVGVTGAGVVITRRVRRCAVRFGVAAGLAVGAWLLGSLLATATASAAERPPLPAAAGPIATVAGSSGATGTVHSVGILVGALPGAAPPAATPPAVRPPAPPATEPATDKPAAASVGTAPVRTAPAPGASPAPATRSSHPRTVARSHHAAVHTAATVGTPPPAPAAPAPARPAAPVAHHRAPAPHAPAPSPPSVPMLTGGHAHAGPARHTVAAGHTPGTTRPPAVPGGHQPDPAGLAGRGPGLPATPPD